MFCAVGTFAVNVGEYVYTHTAKFEVTGENRVTNGDFNVGDGSEGWKDGDGNNISESWRVVTNVGLGDGINAIESQGASTEAAGTLANSWRLTSGLYVISYSVYAPEDLISSITAGGANYVNFFANTTGDNTVERAIASAESWRGEQWTQVVDTIFVNADEEYLVFNASNVTASIKFSQFSIYAVTEVYDSRNIDRLIEYAEKLLQEPDLAYGRDDFEGTVEMLKEAVASPENIKNKDAAEALVSLFNEAFDVFLNENGGNTNSGDWSTVAGKNWNNLNSNNFVGSYWTVGGRWGFFPNAPFARNSAGDMADLERTEGEGYILTAGIQTSMDLGAIGVKIENANLSPGKYFFAIEAQAVAAGNKSAPYGANYNLPFIGPTIQVGGNSVVLEDDTISGYYWKRYYLIGEVAEGETVTASFIFPAYTDKRGGKVSLRNPEFRLLGKTELQINYEAAVKDAYVQQTELKKRLDSYPTDVAGYWWGKGILDEAIAVAQPVYEGSLDIVQSETQSTVDVSDEGVEQLKQLAADLLAQVRALNSAKNNVIAANATITTLESDIASAKAVLADNFYQNGDKDTFQTVINEAEQALNSVKASTTDDTRETDETILQGHIETLAQAVEAFKESAHVTPVIDIDFTNTCDGTTIAGAAGEMTFTNFDTDNAAEVTSFQQGVNGESADVLRVGNGSATVLLPEAPAEDDVIRVQFDMWFGKLVGKYAGIQLQDEEGNRVAGFNLNRYDAAVEYNDFNNEENTGMDIVAYASSGISNVNNLDILKDQYRTSFDLIIDYKSKTLQGIVSCNGKQGIGTPIPMTVTSPITKFVLSSNYNNVTRRCWFDNLKIYKYHNGGSSAVKGDVNGDGTVDVADISAIISQMAGTAQYAAADVNGDGTVDVADISNVISIMAGNDE